MQENLHCPRCGKQFDADTSYCRTCGLSLEGVREIVKGAAASAPEVKTGPNQKVMRAGVGLFILGTVIALVNVAVRDFGLFPEAFGKIVFLAFIIAGLLCLGLGFIFPSKRYVKQNRSGSHTEPSRSHDLKTAPLAGDLPSADFNFAEAEFSTAKREPVQVEPDSVTEHTTRQLN